MPAASPRALCSIHTLRAALSITITILACASCHGPGSASAPPAVPLGVVARGPHGYPSFREMLAGGSDNHLPLDHVEDEPKHFPLGSAAIVGAPDFLFVLGQGSSMSGFDTLKIDASGQAELVFGGKGEGPWKRASFRLSTEELDALQHELAAIDIFALKRGYFAAADDGNQWFVRVRAAEQRKTVVLDNHFPGPIVRIAEQVRVRIVPAHRDAINDATPIETRDKLHGEPVRWPEDVPDLH